MNHPLQLSTYPRISETTITRYSNELVLIWGYYYYNRVRLDNLNDKYFSLLFKKIIEKDPYYRPWECKDNSEYYKFLDDNFSQIVYRLSSSFTWAKYRISSEVKLNFGLPMETDSVETDEAIVEILSISDDNKNTLIQYNSGKYSINLIELLNWGEYISF